MKRLISLLAMLAMLLSAALAEDNVYDHLGFSGEADMWPVQRHGLWGFVDHRGELILPCEWEDVGMVVNGLVPVQKDGWWGIIDRTGNVLIPCKWGGTLVDSYGGLLVLHDGTRGAMSLDGDTLIPCGLYEYIGPAVDGVRHVIAEEKVGLYTTDGAIISECQWADAGYFYEGLAYVAENSYTHGYINAAGELVIPCQYRYADNFVDGSAVVGLQTGGYQLIDVQGHPLCPEPWDEMESFTTNALILVRKGDKYGYINRRGEVVIPVIYDQAQAFGDGLALVRQGDAAFWIDESGAEVLKRPAGYTSTPFKNDVVSMKNAEGLYGLMDKQGHFVTPCQWENHLQYAFGQDEVAMVQKDGQTGFLNRQGELLTGKMHPSDAVEYGIVGEYLFLLEESVLSIWRADGSRLC